MQLHRVLINFCFYPVHLQLIVAANHPMQLQGCARLEMPAPKLCFYGVVSTNRIA